MTHALVIGGGIAGGAAAAHLARAGRDVILIERKAGPHDKVCGEFISSEAVRYLRGLDIDLAALGAVPIAAVNIYTPRAATRSALPFSAVSVSRRALDEAILLRASACGVELRRNRAVRSLRRLGEQWIAELDDGSKLAAGEAFLATGKHDLRGWKRPPGRQNDLIAFKLHWRLSAASLSALGPCVELFLFPGGYAGNRTRRVRHPQSVPCRAAPSFCAAWRQLGSTAFSAPRGLPAASSNTRRGRGLLGSSTRNRLNSLRLCANPGRAMAARRSGRRDPLLHRRRHRDRASFRADGCRLLSCTANGC